MPDRYQILDGTDWPNLDPDKVKKWYDIVRHIWDWLSGKGRRQPDGGGPEGPHSKILIIGPAGSGKTTLAALLTGDVDFLGDPFHVYKQDLFVTETATADHPDRKLVVLPGQKHRRDGWRPHLESLQRGDFCGVIFLTAYGYHSLEDIAYANLKASYGTTRREDFLARYLADRRGDELEVLDQVVPYLANCEREKVWVLNVVAKQDLWSNDTNAVAAFYQGQYQLKFQPAATRAVRPPVRVEFAYASLVIENFAVGKERLSPNTAGFDHRAQVGSVLNLFGVLDGLRRWEES